MNLTARFGVSVTLTHLNLAINYRSSLHSCIVHFTVHKTGYFFLRRYLKNSFEFWFERTFLQYFSSDVQHFLKPVFFSKIEY